MKKNSKKDNKKFVPKEKKIIEKQTEKEVESSNKEINTDNNVQETEIIKEKTDNSIIQPPDDNNIKQENENIENKVETIQNETNQHPTNTYVHHKYESSSSVEIEPVNVYFSSNNLKNVQQKKVNNEQTKKEYEDDNIYIIKTRFFLKNLSNTLNHKTAKHLIDKQNLIYQFVDKELREITSALSTNRTSSLSKTEIKNLEPVLLSKINDFKKALIKFKLFDEVVAKKIGNCIFFIKGKIQSLLSKLPPKDPEENKEQEPKINIQKEYSKNVYNKNQLQFQINQSKFVLLQYPLQYYLPKIEIIKILLDQSPDISPTNTFPENITPSSVMIFGTSHNLFYAIGFCDLLIIADSQMSVIDKFFFDKRKSDVSVLFTSGFLIFLNHYNKFYVFDYHSKTEKHLTCEHKITQVCVSTYYKDSLCLLDSLESLTFIDYVQPKKLFTSDLNPKKNIFAKNKKFSQIIAIGDYIVVSGTQIRAFDINNKKLLTTTQINFSDEINIVTMKNIILNHKYISSNFICGFNDGTLRLYFLEANGIIRELSSYNINYLGMEVSKNMPSNFVFTRKNLAIYSYGKNLMFYNTKIIAEKPEIMIEFDEIRKAKCNHNVKALFENEGILILHSNKLIDNLKFLDLNEFLNEDNVENEVNIDSNVHSNSRYQFILNK